MFAKLGWAMPDGSYYVRPDHPEDLSNAVSAVGRANGGGEQHNAIRRHVISRAKALKAPHKIPDTWNPDGSLKHADEFIEHFGRKGMKWGRHIFGGDKPEHSEDSATARDIKTQAKKSGVHTLSNDELQTAITRMNLETQFAANISKKKGTIKVGEDYVKSITNTTNTGINAYNTGHTAYKLVKPFVEKIVKKP
jgi:hypothetical protein